MKACPKCKSTDLRKHGWKILLGRRRQQYQCKSCGHVFYKRGPTYA